MERGDLTTDLRGDPLADESTARTSLHDIQGLSESELERLKTEMRQVLVMIRPRARAEAQSLRRIRYRAMAALSTLSLSIQHHPGTAQSQRLVRFLAGCYDGDNYPFDLANLRSLDTALAQACIDYLDYDRLDILKVHHHLPGGEPTLQCWIHDYGLRVASYLGG